MATEEGGTAPPPSPREEAKATKGPTKGSGGALRLQQIFEKYGGNGPAVPPKLATFLGPRSHGDRCRSKQSRLHVEGPQSENTGSALKPEILEALTCEVPGAVLTPYGVGVRESQEDEQGFVHVKFAWGTALVAAKDTNDSRSAVLRWQLDSLGSLFALLVSDLGHRSDSDSDSDEEMESGGNLEERPQGLASVKALLAWLEQAALEPKASHQQALLDLALLLSGLVSGRAELLRLEGISSSPQLQAELMAADALRIHLGLLERLGRSGPRKSAGLADSCRSWCQVLEQVGAEQLVGGAWRLVRPGAKQADPLSEEELLSSMPTARRSFVLHMTRCVKVTAGPVLVGPPRTTVLHRPVQSASPLTRAQRLPTSATSPFGLPRQLSGTPAVAYSGALPPGPSASPDVVRRSSTPFSFAPSPGLDCMPNLWLPDRLPASESWSFSPLCRSRPFEVATVPGDAAREVRQVEEATAGSEVQSSFPTETLPSETPATASPSETPEKTPQASEPDATCSLSRTKARSLYVAPLQNRKTGKDTPKADKATASPVRRVKSEKAPARVWR